jgi:glyoxylase-like metal-dependent hydrolase (beta-lactamase superfamily II)
MHPLPDVHLVRGRASNMFLCADESGLALIDAGIPGEQGRVLEMIERLGYQPQDLTRILITHADFDHVGSLAELQKASGATVYAGAETAVFLRSGKGPEHMPALLQPLLNAVVKVKPVPKEVISIFADGDVLPVLGGLQAIATPGHTLDHYSFYSPTRGILFAGDALHTRNGRLQRTQKRITADQEAANRSALQLLELAPILFACGHGDPMDNHQLQDITALFDQLRKDTP